MITYYIKLLMRNLFWLYNASKIEGINQTKFSLPIIVEGKGKIYLGKNTILSPKVILRISKKATLELGNGSNLDKAIEINISSNGSLQTLKECSFGSQSKLYINNKWQFGNNVSIATNCAIFSREKNHYGKLIIGSWSNIGDNTIIDVTDDISIGDEVAIGPNCVIYTHDHDYTTEINARWQGGVISKAIIIGNGAWIGSGVTILPGVTIGERSVIAAGSVLTKSVPPNTLWGGVPAKMIKSI